jgi:hypothetical protein
MLFDFGLLTYRMLIETRRPPRLEPERKGRFQVFFGGKFCYQFYLVMNNTFANYAGTGSADAA